MWLGFRIAEGRVAAAAASKAFPYSSSSTSTFLLSSMGEDDEDGGGGVDVDGLLLRMEARLSFSRLS